MTKYPYSIRNPDFYKIYRSCIFLLMGFLASGCVGWTSISDVPEKSEDFRSQVVIGQTSRTEAHERLPEGVPVEVVFSKLERD